MGEQTRALPLPLSLTIFIWIKYVFTTFLWKTSNFDSTSSNSASHYDIALLFFLVFLNTLTSIALDVMTCGSVLSFSFMNNAIFWTNEKIWILVNYFRRYPLCEQVKCFTISWVKESILSLDLWKHSLLQFIFVALNMILLSHIRQIVLFSI